MKRWYFAVALVCGTLAGAVWMHWPAPTDDEVTAYRKLPVLDYRMLRMDAMAYAQTQVNQGLAFHARPDGTDSFEIRCKGVIVLAVENAPGEVVLHRPSNALRRAPDIVRLMDSFQRLLVLDPRQERLAAKRDEPSWLEAQLRRITERVPGPERCVFGGDSSQ